MEHEWWKEVEIIHWSQLLLASFRHWTGGDLVEYSESPESQSAALFFAPVVVVSHGTEDDPILNYGNHLAIELWETSWEDLRCTPSRLTAEPLSQTDREGMLARALAEGFIKDYRGIRISRGGRRFLIEHALVWTVIDDHDTRHGQAATFSCWTFL